MKTTYNIGLETFTTKKAATDRCRILLKSGGPDDAIVNLRDIALLEALFYSRPDKVAELGGRKIVGWGREKAPANVCFAALLEGGGKRHFSFPKSINALWELQKAPS